MKPEQTHTRLLVFEAREQLSASVPVGPWEQHAQDGGHAVRRHDHILLRFVLDHTQKHLQAEIRASLSVRRGLRGRNAQRTNHHQQTRLQHHKHREEHTGSSPEEQREGDEVKLILITTDFILFINTCFSIFIHFVAYGLQTKVLKLLDDKTESKTKSEWCIYFLNTF